MRVGRFYIRREDIESKVTVKIFRELALIPIRVELFYIDDKFEIVGISRFFDDKGDGTIIPEYELIMTDDVLTVVRKT